jgi:uncharacterized protein
MLGGALAGGITWWLMGSWLGALAGAAIAFFIIFARDPVPHGGLGRYGGRDWDTGGGGSGGGFSGGGGGFGGGGASGRW